MALRSARQPARYATAHSTTRPFYHLLADRNLLDNSPTCSPLTLAHDDQVEPLRSPDVPATFWDPVSFFCAGDLAPIFTALLVLLVEDESNDNTVLGEQQSQLTSYQRWFVGLSEKEREWPMHSQSSYYDQSHASWVPQLRSPSLPSPVTTSAQYFQDGYLVRIYRAWSLTLILSMCSSTADTRPHIPSTLTYKSITPSATSMLFMAKLLTHRHVSIAFFRFPFSQLGSHNIMPSHRSFRPTY